MSIVHTMPEGTTENQVFDIEKNGKVFNATGITENGVRVLDKNGTLVVTAGVVAWVDILKSQIGYAPVAADLPATGSPYLLRFQFTDGGGQIFFSPTTGDGDTWVVQT